MAVRIVAHKPWGGRHLLMEDKWDKTRMRNGSQTRGGRGINRNKWKGNMKIYVYCFACLFSMTCLHARQKGQLASRPPFHMNAQHANVKAKLQVCNMHTSSSYLAIAAFHRHQSSTQPVGECSIKCRDRRWKEPKEVGRWPTSPWGH